MTKKTIREQIGKGLRIGGLAGALFCLGGAVNEDLNLARALREENISQARLNYENGKIYLAGVMTQFPAIALGCHFYPPLLWRRVFKGEYKEPK